jgi:hypothetical protein
MVWGVFYIIIIIEQKFVFIKRGRRFLRRIAVRIIIRFDTDICVRARGKIMAQEKILIVVTVPPDNAEVVLDAIASAGGGIIGHYTHCAFTNMGKGRFKPDSSAHPHVGVVAEINAVDEIRIETFCDRTQAKNVVAAIRQAHPYEEPVIYLIPLLSEESL